MLVEMNVFNAGALFFGMMRAELFFGGYDCLGKMVGVTVVIKVVVEVVMEEAAEAVQVDFSVFYGVHVLRIWWAQKW